MSNSASAASSTDWFHVDDKKKSQSQRQGRSEEGNMEEEGEDD